MSFFRRIIFLFFLFFFFSVSKYCNASEEFSSSFNNIYEVRDNGITKVTQNCSLTNLTTDLRASKYKLILKTTDVNNIYASDTKGFLKLNTEKKDGFTTIEFSFNDIVVGKNKTLNWTMSYETGTLASKNGQVWEIIIPGMPNGQDISNYTITLKVPVSFGPSIFLSPKPKNYFFWTKEEIGTGGIKAIYGSKQIFDFLLTYTLVNKNNHPIATEIVLPSDTEYQKILIKKLDPEPLNVITDKDGNWLAQYNLDSNQKLSVKAIGSVNIFFSPQKKTYLSDIQKSDLISEKKYWEINDPEIKKLALELKTPKKIYDFVVNSLSYDYQKINSVPVKRLGAKEVLINRNKAICMEFTDLFIALVRAAGIPAREKDGFAYTTNSKLRPVSLQNDVLHAWPEYYDLNKNTWIQVDPTWGNTTNGADYFNYFDLNHFVFVTKGENSEYPLPAGSYKKNENEKNVNVIFGSDDNIWTKDYKSIIEIKGPEKAIAGFPFEIDLLINNKLGIYIDPVIINTEVNNLDSLSSKEINFDGIPPFGKQDLKLKFKSKSFFQNKEGSIVFYINGNTISKNILISPLYLDKIIIILGGVFVIITVILVAAISRNIHFQRQK